MSPSEITKTQKAQLKTSTKAQLTAAAIGLAAVLSAPAYAGGTITIGDDKSISLGLGMRDSFTSAEGGAPDGSRSADFSLDSIRIYMGASLNKYIKGTFDTEKAGDGSVHVLDGYAQFEFMDEVNLWVGRMLPPSDRANLDGPYYLNNWLYPGVVSQYPAKFAGRDDGATIWGKLLDKKLVYSAGVFMGHNRAAGASNQGDNPLLAGRIAYSFLDAESDPAYYTSSTYYGSADILTLAVAGMYQKNGVGTAAVHGDYQSFNVDLLYESKMASWGSVTLEGAFYDYDTNNVADVAPLPGEANVGGLSDGKAYLVGVDYLFPDKIGFGMVQPFARFQEFDNDITSKTGTEWDFGLNYILDGHNARISLDYTTNKASGVPSTNKFVAGLQVQF